MMKHLFLASCGYIIVAKADEKTVPREPVSLFFWQIGHRHYDSEVGHFLEPDEPWNFDPSHPSGTNAYAYCYNDPVNYSDRSGHFPVLAAILIGLGASAGIAFGLSWFGNAVPWGDIQLNKVAQFALSYDYALLGISNSIINVYWRGRQK